MNAIDENLLDPLKIVVLGEANTGKTSFVIAAKERNVWREMIGQKLETEKISPSATDTLEYESLVHRVPRSYHPMFSLYRFIPIHLYDSPAFENLQRSLPAFVNGASCGLLFFAADNAESEQRLNEYASLFRENALENAPLLLVGSKADICSFQHKKTQFHRLKSKLSFSPAKILFLSSTTGLNLEHLITEAFNSAYFRDLCSRADT